MKNKDQIKIILKKKGQLRSFMKFINLRKKLITLK